MNEIDYLLARKIDPKNYSPITNLVIKQIAKKFFEEIEDITETRVFITSAREGIHSPNSYHNLGKAIDFVLITSNLKELYNKELADTLKKIAVKYDFWLIDEYSKPSAWSSGGHFHIEYRK